MTAVVTMTVNRFEPARAAEIVLSFRRRDVGYGIRLASPGYPTVLTLRLVQSA